MYKYVVIMDGKDYCTYAYLEDAIRALRNLVKGQMDSLEPKIIGIKLV